MRSTLKLKYRFFMFLLVGLLVSTSVTAEESSNPGDFNPAVPAFHHISDANVYSIGPFCIPLPYMIYVPGEGWHTGLTSAFGITMPHGDGLKAVDGFVLYGGRIKRILDPNFPKGEVVLGKDAHEMHTMFESKEVSLNGKSYNIAFENSSTADGGVFGGGITSFYDFSITKNIAAMMMVCIFMIWAFIGFARKYKKREGKAPEGGQGLFEVMFVFIQDEVAKPFLGRHWERFLPFLMTIFFFILGLNLFGQVPFLGNANVTGNLAVTCVLAIIVFIVTTISGNRHYWEHVFWMPGVPAWVKIILTPVEIIGLFIKPITLMLRLFANITAGHMVVVIFVGLIFLFGESGRNMTGTAVGGVLATVLALFMMAIELLVAFIQAFVFTILTASYLSAATEDAHHEHDDHHGEHAEVAH